MRSLVRRAARRTRLATLVGARLGGRLYGGTDKVTHGYLAHYDHHFGRARWRVRTVVEIGVGGNEARTPGGSLRLWRDVFPRARVIGIDLHDKDVDLGSRVSFVRADQTDTDALARVVEDLGGAIDVVIDDGSHVGEHVRRTFDALFPHVRPGGTYAIEDLHTSYWADYGGAQDPPVDSAVGLLRELVDDVQAQDRSFARRHELGAPPTRRHAPVASVTIHPGMALIVRGA